MGEFRKRREALWMPGLGHPTNNKETNFGAAGFMLSWSITFPML